MKSREMAVEIGDGAHPDLAGPLAQHLDVGKVGPGSGAALEHALRGRVGGLLGVRVRQCSLGNLTKAFLDLRQLAQGLAPRASAVAR